MVCVLKTIAQRPTPAPTSRIRGTYCNTMRRSCCRPNGSLLMVPTNQGVLPLTRLMTSTITAITSSRWMREPPICPTRPRSQRTNRITIIVQSIYLIRTWRRNHACSNIYLLGKHLKRALCTANLPTPREQPRDEVSRSKIAAA